MTATYPSPTSGTMLFTLSEESCGLYRARPQAFVLSMLGQAAVIGLLVWLTTCVAENPRDLKGRISNVINEVGPLIFSGVGGGGGGSHDLLPASHGALPRPSLSEQFTPPMAVLMNAHPALPVESTIVVAPEVKFDGSGQQGDSLSHLLAPSGGPGGPGGIGTGCCNGVGNYNGPGTGPGPGGRSLGGQGLIAPRLLYDPEPDYSEEARKVKAQGSVLLWLIVGADGHPRDIRVQRALGWGLDEKAVDTVRTWRFAPAMRNGQPVAAPVSVEVRFRLY